LVYLERSVVRYIREPLREPLALGRHPFLMVGEEAGNCAGHQLSLAVSAALS
jgi:hypothetical protein